MTKQINKLAVFFASRLVNAGGPKHMDPVTRDAWASIARWQEDGAHVWRIDGDEDDAPELSDDLPLATAPLWRAAACYHGPKREEWILVARHDAAEPIYIGRGAYAFPEPMITYLTMVENQPAAGCLNLVEQPTWGSVYLPAGKRGAAWLAQDDIAVEERRMHRALRHWYRPPAIVI